MPGNSNRRGAVRKTKKGPTVGSGGQRRKSLQGRGPTPKASERTGHPAAAKAKRQGGRPASKRAPRRSGEGGTEWIVGRNAVLEALRAGVPAATVEIAARVETDERIKAIRSLAAERGIPLMEVPRADLDRRSEASHQGVAMKIPAYNYAELTPLLHRTDLLVALDGVTDPHNLGAVLRSAGAFGAGGVIVPERRSAGVNAAAWKVSAGAAARVPVARVTNLVRALEECKSAGFFVVGLDGKGPSDIDRLELATSPVVLVVGSEGKGLSTLVAKTCDVIAAIPIAAEMESLNAAVAAGISLYQIDRLRARGGAV